MGYIGRLEARLAETEATLFQMISAFHAVPPAKIETILQCFSNHYGHSTRSNNQDIWDRFPLGSTQQQYVWWNEMCRLIVGQAEPPLAPNGSTSDDGLSMPSLISPAIAKVILPSPNLAEENAVVVTDVDTADVCDPAQHSRYF